MMPNRRSRLKHHILTHKKHAFALLFSIIGIFLLSELIIFVYKNHHDLIYPQLSRNQLSPKDLIKDQNIKLDESSLPPIIEHGSRYQYKVAITIDADMTQAMKDLLDLGVVKSWYNPAIKQIIDQEQVPTTIFVSGLWVETYPGITKQLADDPLIEIGNHSYSPPAFTKNCFRLPLFDGRTTQNDILSTQQTIISATGKTPKYFRFPGGCFKQMDLETVHQLGLEVIHWDVVSTDGFNNDLKSITQTVESNTQNGSIIVFHIQGGSFAPQTSEALKIIIPYLKKRGYQLVTISDLLNYNQ